MTQQSMRKKKRHITLAQAQQALATSTDPFIEVLTHGSLSVELYEPRGLDLQTPHTRDELYVVVRGAGWFVNGEERHPFGVGDVLFVPAGVVHRFEEFGDDLSVWVVFYGPEGGEAE